MQRRTYLHISAFLLASFLFFGSQEGCSLLFAKTPPPPQTVETGFVPLFDGKTLDGWEKKGGIANYRVENSEIVGTSQKGTPNTFLCTKKHYANFILELDFKVNPKMNSGIQIRSNAYDKETEVKWNVRIPFGKIVTEPDGTKSEVLGFKMESKGRKIPAGKVHGYQVEIDPSDRAWSGGIYDESRRGWLNNLEKNEAARKAFKQNEWNHYKIVAKGNRIKTWINGVPAAHLYDKMTATGFIALQVHNTPHKEKLEVRWKNIKIKVLDK